MMEEVLLQEPRAVCHVLVGMPWNNEEQTGEQAGKQIFVSEKPPLS
jgi:hypothetical protein